jgi:hypothetical protein
MYGLVNQAMKDLVLSRFGPDTWSAITDRAGVAIDPFLTMRPYPDEATYKLVEATSEQVGMPAEDLLGVFGEFWVDHSAEHGYGDLLALMGDDLPSFLHAVDGMHDRLRLSFPDLSPPSIWCTDITSTSLTVHYASDRPGLDPFLVGLLRAVARRFGETAQVRLLRGRQNGHDHEEFEVVRTAVA